MKKIVALIIVLNLTSQLVSGQNKSNIPPGTISLNDSLFIDKEPITNLMFLEYLTVRHFLKENGFESLSDYHRITEKKLNKIVLLYPSFLENLNEEGSILTRKNYFKKTEYKYSPVLKISKKQAEDFCSWRTEMVKHLWSKRTGTKDVELKYRLPKIVEYKSAEAKFAEANIFNYYEAKNPTKFFTKKEVNEYIKYNISEFTFSDKIYGENWKNEIPKELPNEVVGFRCVCEIEP